MNNNLNHGNNHTETQMNVITKATSVAVLVVLGLTLTAWAAEPAATPNAETRPDPARTPPPLRHCASRLGKNASNSF